jgi:hypothetical protein
LDDHQSGIPILLGKNIGKENALWTGPGGVKLKVNRTGRALEIPGPLWAGLGRVTKKWFISSPASKLRKFAQFSSYTDALHANDKNRRVENVLF